MSTYLKFLEIDNFKSYEGKVLIGPLRGFSAIVGPNGSGKSNLMDAISFVFGERPNALRVKKLSDLIHGSNIKQPASNRCSVTAVLVTKDGRTETEKTFQRSATDRERGADSEYRVDQMVVTREDYVTELEKLNIIIKPRNFLVFQGQVMNIATQNPKQRTQWLEKVSRSGELKDEYESLEKEYNEAQEQMRRQAKMKNEIIAAEKEARANKKEADDYESRKLRVEELDIEIRLLKLCYFEREIDKVKQQLNEKKDREEEEEAKHTELEKEQDDLKKKLSQLSREVNKQEQEVRKYDIQLMDKRPKLTSLQSKINQLKETSEREEKVVSENERRLVEAKGSVGKLNDEIDIVKRNLKHAEEEARRLEHEGGSTTLTPEQLERYRTLKDQANQQAGALNEQLESLKRELAVEREMLSASEREAKHKRSDLQARDREETSLREKIDSLNGFIATTTASMDEKKQQAADLESQLANVQGNQVGLQQRLDEVQQQLSDVSVSRNELDRHERKRDVIDKLKQVFGETSVYGRLIELTEPANPRFRSAVTRIFAKHMNSVVVSTQGVAADCIKYLREQEMEPELFLPIDTIKARDIDIRLRELDPKCRLVFDIVEVRHQDRSGVQKILKFICGNSLVCEDERDKGRARRVAYGNPGERHHERQQVVTLEGTLFEKSGVISGGAQAISAKAKSWSTKEYEKLKKEEATLQEQLSKVRRKESELQKIELEISNCKTRINSAQTDVKDALKRIDEIKRDLERLGVTCKALDSQVRSKHIDVDRVQARMQQSETDLDAVEDKVFHDFCREVGVNNIRDFEKRDLEEKQKREKRIFEMKKHFNKLTQQLNYEQTGVAKVERKIESSTNIIENARGALETAEADLEKGNEEVAVVEGALDGARADLDERRSAREAQQGLVDDKKKQLQESQRALQKIQRQITSEAMVLDQKRNERLQLLQDCRMEGIELPLEKGSMDDINVGEVSSTQTASNTSSASQDTSVLSQQSTPSSAQQQRSPNRAVWAKEPKIKVDYSSLPSKVRELSTHEQQVKAIKDREKDYENLRTELATMHPPLPEAENQLSATLSRKKAAQKETEDARKRFIDAQTRFVKTRKERLKRFKQCLNTVSERIDEIYKELNNDMTAQAYITPDSQDLPFTEGVSYSLVVPGKQYRFIDQLSGGEKTLAALSLLFAVHRARPSPFYIMDEIDAALDNQNIGRVAAFMNKKSATDFQCIVISLKEELFLHSDCLVGIYPEHNKSTVSHLPRSKALMFDLTAHTDKRNTRRGGRDDDEDEGTSGDDDGGANEDDEDEAAASDEEDDDDEAASSGRISSEEGSGTNDDDRSNEDSEV